MLPAGPRAKPIAYPSKKSFPIVDPTGVLVRQPLHPAFAVGLPEDQPDMKDALLDALDYFVPPQNPSKAKLKAFEQWLLKSCTTKAGRFVRVTFVTGRVVDLVPKGSVATGQRLVGEQRRWYHGSPDIQELWRRYVKGYKSKRG